MQQQSDTMNGILENTRQGFQGASQRLADGYEAARKQLVKAESQLEEVVKKNPLIAVAAAVGIGWVVGRVLSSRIGGSTSKKGRSYRGEDWDPSRSED